MRTIEQALQAFSGKDVQTAGVILRTLRNFGYTPKDLLVLLEQNTAKQMKAKRFHEKVFGGKCPECEGPISVIPLNTKRCNQVGGDYTYLRYCRNCDYEQYLSDKDLK